MVFLKKVGLILIVFCLFISVFTFKIWGASGGKKQEQISSEQVKTEVTQANTANVEDGTVEELKQNQYLKQNDFKELNEAEVSIDKKLAIEKAKEIVGSRVINESKKVKVVLTKYTRGQIKKIPESDLVLDNYPTWVVTFYGVTLEKQGSKSTSGDNSVYADINVLIDANSGKEISTISHTSSLTK